METIIPNTFISNDYIKQVLRTIYVSDVAFLQVSIVDARKDKARPEKENFGQHKVNFVLILLPACLLCILFTYLSKDILKDCIKKGCRKLFSQDF